MSITYRLALIRAVPLLLLLGLLAGACNDQAV